VSPGFTETDVSVPEQSVNEIPRLLALSALPVAETVAAMFPWLTRTVWAAALALLDVPSRP